MDYSIQSRTHFPDPRPVESGPAGSEPPSAIPVLMPLILVVEDDRRMRKYLRATLADQRFRVVDAESGSEGLIQASGHNQSRDRARLRPAWASTESW